MEKKSGNKIKALDCHWQAWHSRWTEAMLDSKKKLKEVKKLLIAKLKRDIVVGLEQSRYKA